MYSVLGWMKYKRHAVHAWIVDPKTGRERAACGLPMKPGAKLVREPHLNVRRCYSCVRALNRAMRVEPPPNYLPARYRGSNAAASYSYLGWSRALFGANAHHLIIIDNYHERRAVCRQPFHSQLLAPYTDKRLTRLCGVCLRSRAFEHYGRLPEGWMQDDAD